MKIFNLRMGLFIFFVLIFSSGASAQRNFDKFLVNFKKAVIKTDRKSVAALTDFPVSYVDINTAEQEKVVTYSKQKFLNQYDTLFDKSRRQCFKDSAFTVNDSNDKNRRSIECEKSSISQGIAYSFFKTKSGWKLGGIAIKIG